MKNLRNALIEFKDANGIQGKGPLCVALIVTRHAKNLGLPLNPDDLLTPKGGQVKGLGKASVQKILGDHGIKRVLAEEGGRTSRGSIDGMKLHVEFLNNLAKQGEVDLDSIESFWVEQVNQFFSSQPFVLRHDPSKSLRAVVHDLIEQAFKRQKEAPGTMYAGAVMQHLVGAKLDIIMGSEQLVHHGFSVADDSTGRSADFKVEDTAIHVTSAPGEALIRKCKKNLDSGLKPVIVTNKKGVEVAEGLAGQKQIDDRIDIFEIEQFVATNVYEKSDFKLSERPVTIGVILERYNSIVESCETDYSLKIELN